MAYLSMCLRVLCRTDFDVWFLQNACNDAVLTVRLRQLVRGEKKDHEIFLLGVSGSFMFQGKMELILSYKWRILDLIHSLKECRPKINEARVLSITTEGSCVI